MASTLDPSLPFITNWLQSFNGYTSTNLQDDPNYYVSKPQTLITHSTPIRYSLGTGHQLLTSILPTCLETEHELIIVTCFWAKSTSRDAISDMLRTLSKKGLSQKRQIQVRICFSSRSIMQKLFQTSSLTGKIYPPSSWVEKLGLPSPDELRGLDLVVKSIFVRPFSVMHPKFILVDRNRAFMPSCNVSWESWFEGCIEIQGGICKQLFEFWDSFWARSSPLLNDSWQKDFELKPIVQPYPGLDRDLITHRNFENGSSIPTVLLPSAHHINPRFTPFSRSTPPTTPLNTFLLEAINSATSSIYMQTPNLTSRPLIRALLEALRRGVSITIITSSWLMILEQLVTAFTITEFEIWKLKRRYNKLLRQHDKIRASDREIQLIALGTLKIGYYHARTYEQGEQEPVKSHLKLTVIDEEVVVLGSGNMDRASWYTSQELGIALLDREFASSVVECTGGGLIDRVTYVHQ